MPNIDVGVYKDDDGSVPVENWLQEMQRRDKRIVDKCRIRIALLEDQGHELHRPLADYLRDDIYELRIQFQSVNYRILYFFYGRAAAILAHGLTKEDSVPDKDINTAIERRKKYINSPEEHQKVLEVKNEQNEQRA